MTLIELNGVRKAFGTHIALDGVDLSIHAGQLFAVVGPNGSGKSTLVNVISGLVTPTAGTVSLFGEDAGGRSASLRQRVGVVHEDFGVYHELSGLEHVQYMIRSKGTDEDPAALLERVGLAAVGETRAAEYSGGMVKRLGLAMALVGDPDLLLLDEPFRALDLSTVRSIESILRDRRDRGKTVVFSTHQFEYVDRLCDGACLLADGAVIGSGSVEQLCGEDARLVVEGADVASVIDQGGSVEIDAYGSTSIIRGEPAACLAVLEKVIETGDGVRVHFSHPSLANRAEEEP